MRWPPYRSMRSLGFSRSRGGIGNTGRFVVLLALGGIFILHQSNRVIAYLQSSLVAPLSSNFSGEHYDGTSPKEKADSADPDFDLARHESLGFFTDVSSHHWNLLKKKVKDMSPNFNTWCLPAGKVKDNRQNQPGFFYQNHYEPDFVCQHERRIGKLGDGGKWICDPHRITGQEDCLVYSIGSNNDFSFETFVLKDIGQHCEIHTFDFGNYAQGAKHVGYRLHNGVNKTAVTYHQVGMGLDDPPKYKSLQTIVKELGHEGRTIDIFKIDCEGCEWTTAKYWFQADVTLRQILVELHKSDVVKTPQFFDLMYENGYVIFHKEANIAYSGPKNLAIEYALLKLAPEFHAGEGGEESKPPPASTPNDSAKLHDLKAIKTKEGHFNGSSWKIVDWKDPISDDERSKFACDMVTFNSSFSGKDAQICVHTFRDIVSGNIRRKRHWGDCDILPQVWEGLRSSEDGEQEDDVYYVEIGANIGSCVMEMLLGTNAKIIAFEPHPMNVFNLKSTVSELGQSYQDRLVLFPVGLGAKEGTFTIYSGHNNMGNSVIGKIIKDGESQQFEKKLQFPVHVQRLGSILDAANIRVRLLKMDAQGFECNILDGMGEELAAKIHTIKFEYADKWLNGQNCTNLLPRLNTQFHFNIYRRYAGEGKFSMPLEGSALGTWKKHLSDLFASKWTS